MSCIILSILSEVDIGMNYLLHSVTTCNFWKKFYNRLWPRSEWNILLKLKSHKWTLNQQMGSPIYNSWRMMLKFKSPIVIMICKMKWYLCSFEAILQSNTAVSCLRWRAFSISMSFFQLLNLLHNVFPQLQKGFWWPYACIEDFEVLLVADTTPRIRFPSISLKKIVWHLCLKIALLLWCKVFSWDNQFWGCLIFVITAILESHFGVMTNASS